MTAKNVVRGCLACLAVTAIVTPMMTLSAQQLKARLLQTNGAGDTVSVIDPVTDKVIAEIPGIEQAHGVQAAADGSRIFITSESDNTVVAVDGKTLKEIKRIPLSGHPHNLAFPKNSGKVYVAIHSGQGGLDVIDVKTLAIVKHIPLENQQVHNPFPTPDGRFILACPDTQIKKAFVVDTKTDDVVWDVQFDRVVRPAAFSTNPDGSTKWAFISLAGMSGFAVVDWATHKEIRRIETPYNAKPIIGMGGPKGEPHGVPSHGIGVAPDNSSVWVNSRMDNCVYAYSLPDLKLLGYVPTQYDAMWMSFTPDGRKLYIANNGAGTVSVIDVQKRKVAAIIPVGQAPKRNTMAMLP